MKHDRSAQEPRNPYNPRIPDGMSAGIPAPFPASWAEILPPEAVETASELVESTYTLQYNTVNTSDVKYFNLLSQVFPPRSQVFRALDLTPPERVRAVILGQDPYPTAGHANGLSFSVSPQIHPIPPSLRNIFKEYAACTGLPAPENGDLSLWAERGVLLLNTVLTVQAGKPGSHRRYGWQRVTDAVLRACLGLPGPVVFLLWGRDAQAVFDRAVSALSICVKHYNFTDTINSGFCRNLSNDNASSATACHHLDASPCQETSSPCQETSAPYQETAFPYETAGAGKYVLRSSHPSPLGAAKPCGDSPPFLGSRPFARANALLGPDAIDWRLT